MVSKAHPIEFICTALDIVCLQHGGKDRKPVLGVERVIEVVAVDTRDLDFITRLRRYGPAVQFFLLSQRTFI
jgi:hypothetical protein